ncbi:hypothetical protein [Thiococcus pfennigii]|uniref:hypothetical protein n=1 Tax=Thiococcus pfennigii TaxID=1057 RepID=UPI001907AEFC|nr:hypothetical protein [Thiococcus pfennigii]MBK1733643.1 hypothetical protein [Thiococcus pfennigii]
MSIRHLSLDGYPVYAAPPRRVLEAIERQHDEHERLSALAQDRYEQRVIAEARAIAAGTSPAAPTVEHLRVVLRWLDGAQWPVIGAAF